MKKVIQVAVKEPQYVVSTDVAFAQVDAWFGHTVRDLKLDVIYPEHTEKRPCIVWICGGAWLQMSVSAHLAYLCDLAREGFVVASVQYRTSNEAVFPAQLEDVKAAIRYLKAHSERYGIDPERFGVMGESAGGHLTVMTALTGGHKEFDKGDYLEYSSAVQAACPWYLPADVINGGNVSEERRQRVEQSIQKLGYQVNGIARKMRTQRTDYVVVILPDITNPFYSLLLQGLEHALSAYDKQPLLCISDGEKEKEIKYIEMARTNKVDGIIGVTFSDVEEYLDDTLAFVSIERRFSKNIPCVSGDNYLGGRMAAENLVRRGATNLLLVQTIMSVDNEVRKRRLGFEGYCEENEIPYASITFSEKQVPSVYSSFSARSLIGSVLQAHMNNQMTENGRPNGIFAGTDHLAIVIQEELEQMGLRVPEDVQVIGYDGLRWMNTGQPFVSSIYQDTGIIAKTSVDCLMRLLNGEAVEDIVDLPIVFQDGGTTLPLPETDIKEKQGIMLPILEGEDRR